MKHASFLSLSRCLLLAPLVFTLLLAPARTLFACALMDGPVRAVCCRDGAAHCDMGGGCDTHAQPGAGCCEKVSAPVDAVSSVPAAHALAVLVLDAPQPPPLVPKPHSLAVAEQLPSSFNASSGPSWLAGTRTYLLTRRLRN